jgi:hypothetical protein
MDGALTLGGVEDGCVCPAAGFLKQPRVRPEPRGDGWFRWVSLKDADSKLSFCFTIVIIIRRVVLADSLASAWPTIYCRRSSIL